MVSDILRRELAPITAEAFRRIDEEAKRVLGAGLTARRVVDFNGPKGLAYSAVNLGQLSRTHEADQEGVRYGVRRVLPLTEIRVPFTLDLWDLDNLSRGNDDFDSRPLRTAVRKLVDFEERAIYRGFEPGAMAGILAQAKAAPGKFGNEPAAYPDVVAEATLAFADAGVGGPYALVLGNEPYRRLAGHLAEYPAMRRVQSILDGPVLHTTAIERGLLLSRRGGDFQMTVGQDIGIGFDYHDGSGAHLYFTESFTFQVLEPLAALTA